MYHPFAMDIYQSPGNLFELSGVISSVTDVVSSGNEILRVRTDLRPDAPW